MFDQLFRYPAVVRRHRDGPLAHERATYLVGLANRGSATGTLLGECPPVGNPAHRLTRIDGGSTHRDPPRVCGDDPYRGSAASAWRSGQIPCRRHDASSSRARTVPEDHPSDTRGRIDEL